jgi:hypothetical protein
MSSDVTGALVQAPSSAVRQRRQSASSFVSGTTEYVAAVQELSDNHVADLSAQVEVARNRERTLWILFIVLFVLTMAIGCSGVIFIFLASLKLAVASGAAGLLPGCASALLKAGQSTATKNRKAAEAQWGEQLKLRQGAAAVDALPPGPDKDALRVEYARKMLARIPTK